MSLPQEESPRHFCLANHGVVLRTLPQSPDDTRLIKVVRRHLEFHTITDGQADPTFAHLAGDGGKNDMFILQLDTKHGAGQNGVNAAFDFDVFFFQTEFPGTCRVMGESKHPGPYFRSAA